MATSLSDDPEIAFNQGFKAKEKHLEKLKLDIINTQNTVIDKLAKQVLAHEARINDLDNTLTELIKVLKRL